MMSMISLFALYLLVGCLFTFLMDCLLVQMDPEMEFDWKEMSVCMSIWPVFVGITLVAFVQGLVGN